LGDEKMTISKTGKDIAKDHYNQAASKYYERYQENFQGYDLTRRINIILKRLQQNKSKSVFDVGCGTCEPMIILLKNGFDVWGNDFSENMIKYGKKHLAESGFDPSLISVGDIENKETLPTEKFDAVVVLGPFPNVIDEKNALTNIDNMLKPNGRVYIDLCNSLFALFSLNSYSKDFFLNDLIDTEKIPEHIKKELEEFYRSKCFEPPRIEVAKWRSSNPRIHNPLTVEKELFEPNGFKVDRLHFNHYHIMPPVFEDNHPDLFKKLSSDMEYSNDWKGYFMASAFIVEAVKQFGST
jgi:2-polyprenyl-3-methyl-5-hydroxy-6-metoxy-1,4-benzoquinol methylase